VVVSMIWKFRK